MEINKSFSKLALCTDGSINSMDAIEAGIDLAKRLGASIYILYVENEKLEDKKIESDESYAKEAINQVIKSGQEYDLDFNPIILKGDPAEKIIDYSKNNDISLIIIGTKGHSGIKKFMLGSVAEKVVRHSSIPVMVVQSKFTQNGIDDKSKTLPDETLRDEKLREKREHVKFPE
ncbi:universal stress protein [Methanosalsum natronophilum]|uniref:Universal stress protein n=1 Tax=Methanosalsum natronophilum TaxID=768733 RepID=A0A3R7XGR6_9EURY|nr:MAG: universal stress protein [Methanosalsum natronophilum]